MGPNGRGDGCLLFPGRLTFRRIAVRIDGGSGGLKFSPLTSLLLLQQPQPGADYFRLISVSPRSNQLLDKLFKVIADRDSRLFLSHASTYRLVR